MTVHDSDTIIKFIIALMIFESFLEVECECDQDATQLDVAVAGRDGARGPTLHRVRAEIPCVGPYVPYVGSV